MNRRGRLGLAAAVLAFAAGIALGGALGLAANDEHHRTIAPRASAPVAPLPRRSPIIPDTLLVWTSGGLPAGFADRVSALPGVARAVPVISGTAWLTRSYSSDGALVDRPPAGLAIPIEVGAAELHSYASFMSPVDRAFLPALARGQGVLGTMSAKLRHLGPGGVLRFGPRRIRVAGVVADTEIGANEVFVSPATAARLGIDRQRYLLIDPKAGVPQERIGARIRALLPAGVPVRIRGPGQTTFMRQGDAVLPQSELKTLFGEFAARPAPGGFLDVDPKWEAAHIVTTAVPVLGTVHCNRAIMPQLRGAMEEVARSGLSQTIDPSQYGGCYVPKFLRNDPTAGVSHHAWGVAVDINVASNPFGHTPHQDLRLVQIFRRWGFIWGGDFLVPDGMHFEFVRFSSG